MASIGEHLVNVHELAFPQSNSPKIFRSPKSKCRLIIILLNWRSKIDRLRVRIGNIHWIRENVKTVRSLMKLFKPTAVFLGPSLRKDEARQILDSDYYPPVKKGDIYRIIASGVKTIILIDGVLPGARPVWHREILEAIDRGIAVCGASGIGAVRAAELQAFGMMGLGTIFEWYRDEIIDGDDEVALQYDHESDDFSPLSEPLVNIRYALLDAVKDNCLSAERAEDAIAHIKQLYYADRSFKQLLDSPVVRGLSQFDRERLANYLLAKQVNLKKIDAIKILTWQASNREILSPQFQYSFLPPTPEIQTKQLAMTGFVAARNIVTGSQLWQAAIEDADSIAPLRETLSQHCFIRAWAQQNGVCVPEESLDELIKDWQTAYNIIDSEEWLLSNGLTRSSYRHLLRDRLLINWIAKQTFADLIIDKSWQITSDRKLQLSDIIETELTGDRASANSVESPDNRESLLSRCLILEWAKCKGVYPQNIDKTSSIDPRELVDWIVKQGPNYFGIPWSFPIALFRELQITGKAAQIIENRQKI